MANKNSNADRTEKASGNVNIQIGGDVNGSQVIGAGGDVLIEGGMQSYSAANDFAEAFKIIYQKVESRPIASGVEKTEIVENVQKIEAEVKKGEAGNTSAFEMRLKMLAAMAPDIAEVVAVTLANPILGISTAFRKIAEKAKAEMRDKPNDQRG